MRNRNSESGFALLFVFAMAAVVAISLYIEMPRVAFEAQRDKEQLLIDRGEQYSRAIQLYVRKFNRYPPDFDALDKTQNIRFLRGHYNDPMTGKSEWRLIHVGPGGVFTDSLLYNKKKTDGSQPEKQTFIAELPTVLPADAGQQQVNLATRRRDSDQPNAPGANPAPPDAPVPPNGQAAAGQFGQFPAGGLFPGGSPLPPGVQLPPGIQLPGIDPSAVNANQPGAAAALINQLLTSPRPGGLNGLQPQPVPTGSVTATLQPQAAAAPIIGGGIAGVASKIEQEGIKVYRDRKPYNEWEFVYDITKDTARAGAVPQPQPAAPALPATPTPPPTPPPAPVTPPAQ